MTARFFGHCLFHMETIGVIVVVGEHIVSMKLTEWHMNTMCYMLKLFKY